jgi:DUF4097 and DUF4098 domain-containing protein YvlB
VRGNCRTVNGRITVGSSTQVGALHTVNGSVDIARDVVVAGSVGTVNGSLSLAENVTVEGDLETVNGALSCAGGTVTGEASTINGTISLAGTRVGGSVATTNGAERLRGQSRVVGDIVIHGTKPRRPAARPLVITIAEGSVVEGDVIVRDDDRKVQVILESGGTVLGKVVNAEVVDRSSDA